MKSDISAEDILERANSVSRPVKVPNVVVGYIADLIIKLAKQKIKKQLSTTARSPSILT
jgi:hypothetical protein